MPYFLAILSLTKTGVQGHGYFSRTHSKQISLTWDSSSPRAARPGGGAVKALAATAGVASVAGLFMASGASGPGWVERSGCSALRSSSEGILYGETGEGRSGLETTMGGGAAVSN